MIDGYFLNILFQHHPVLSGRYVFFWLDPFQGTLLLSSLPWPPWVSHGASSVPAWLLPRPLFLSEIHFCFFRFYHYIASLLAQRLHKTFRNPTSSIKRANSFQFLTKGISSRSLMLKKSVLLPSDEQQVPLSSILPPAILS